MMFHSPDGTMMMLCFDLPGSNHEWKFIGCVQCSNWQRQKLNRQN